MKMYFPIESTGVVAKVLFDIRAQIALSMLERNGLIIGKDGPEDSQGRAKIIELPPIEVVKRAFDIAEEFIRVCEEKTYIRDCEMNEETATIRKAEIERKALSIRYREPASI